ncbi:BRO family, N-terminal domain [Pantoea ananatis]|uniref:P22AR C-terminal domain-containing protein n=1 Tax=Pantoea ananas TaxID=553 RepID=UPI0009D337DE|nr:P22AR C-terminal domain-containing protein [Pantoea ananatis]SKA79364.1 BRO family, N-terminal domain [Pantoea ananatis]
MTIVAKSEFNFQGNAIVPVANLSGIWLTSTDIANALQYKSSKSITNLFNQNYDEFTSGMTQVIESVTSGNYRKKVRVFSLRGAHLIAMFARTNVAKEFRRWVLDILDREVQHSPIVKQFTDEELCKLTWMWFVGERMRTFSRELREPLRQIKSQYAGKAHDFGHEFNSVFTDARDILNRHTQHIDKNSDEGVYEKNLKMPLTWLKAPVDYH